MIVLRILSLLAGALVLILPTLVLSDASDVGVSGMTAVAALLGMAGMFAIFIYIGVAGDRLRRSGRARALGAVLMAVPIMGCLGLLVSHQDEDVLWCSGVLLMFSLMIFLSFVLPVLEHRQRPMRRRERHGLV